MASRSARDSNSSLGYILLSIMPESQRMRLRSHAPPPLSDASLPHGATIALTCSSHRASAAAFSAA